MVTTRADAQRLVDSGKAKIIVALPVDTLSRIQSGQHPLIDIVYDELEPVRASQLRFYSYVQTNELNRSVLIAVVDQAKAGNQATAQVPLQDFVPTLQGNLDQYDAAVRARNPQARDAASTGDAANDADCAERRAHPRAAFRWHDGLLRWQGRTRTTTCISDSGRSRNHSTMYKRLPPIWR